MRQLRYIFTIAICALMAGCELEDGFKQDYSNVGIYLWRIASDDLNHINEAFALAMHYREMLAIEDATERDEYRTQHIRGDIAIEGNKHTITYQTMYDTTYTVTIVMETALWRITRSGGNGYVLTLAPYGDDIRATFEQLYHNESSGYGQFTGRIDVEDGAPLIRYTGSFVMVDRSADNLKPLTVTTKILSDIVYVPDRRMREGKIEITAVDELYGSTDVATATLIRFENHVFIDSMGTKVSYDY